MISYSYNDTQYIHVQARSTFLTKLTTSGHRAQEVRGQRHGTAAAAGLFARHLGKTNRSWVFFYSISMISMVSMENFNANYENHKIHSKIRTIAALIGFDWLWSLAESTVFWYHAVDQKGSAVDSAERWSKRLRNPNDQLFFKAGNRAVSIADYSLKWLELQVPRCTKHT